MATIKELILNGIENLQTKFYISMIQRNPQNISYINNPSEKILIVLVTKNPEYVRYIAGNYREKLTEAVQLAAVKQKPSVIQYIQHCTENVSMYINNLPETTKLKMIEKYPSLIGHFNEPSEKLQLTAIEKEPSLIFIIPTPSEAVQLAAIEKDTSTIKYISDAFHEPSEAVQLAIVEKMPLNIKYINNPSEAVQLAAVQQNPDAILHIENPSEEVQLAAVRQNGNYIQTISNPSDRVVLAAVNQSGFFIDAIDNPSEKVQLAAIEKDPYSIKYIKNPSEKVQLAAIRKDPQIINLINDTSSVIQMSTTKNNGEVVGKIYLKSLKGEISEIIEYNNFEEYLAAINNELHFNPDGFKYVTLTKNAETRKAVDDLIYGEFGIDNPHAIEWYASNNKSESIKIGTTLASEFKEKGYESIAETINEKITKFSGKDNTKETCHQLEILKSGARTLYGDITVEKTNGVFSASVNNLSIKDASTGKTENLRANGMDIKQIPADNMKKLLSGGTVQKANQSLSLSKMAGGWTFKAATMVFNTAEAQASI